MSPYFKDYLTYLFEMFELKELTESELSFLLLDSQADLAELGLT